MKLININCDGCHAVTEVTRTNEIPDNVISLGCNWCPSCEDDANDYYDEWYNTGGGDGDEPDEPTNPFQKDLFPLYEVQLQEKKLSNPSHIKHIIVTNKK